MTPPRAAPTVFAICVATMAAMMNAPDARGDNKRLNDGVVANVHTIQHQVGCTTNVKINPQLQLAAEWHADDLLDNRTLDGDAGSDGSTPQDRANAVGFLGRVTETVAINPWLAMNNLDVLHQWYDDPRSYTIMSDCANTQIGVWSVNSMDRTVLVAVYGQPTSS